MSIDTNYYNQSIALGTIAGLAAPNLIKKHVAPPVNSRLLKNLYNANTLDKKDIDTLEKASDEAFKNSGLIDYGVKLTKVDEHTLFTKEEQKILDTFDKLIPNKKLREAKKAEAVLKYSMVKGYNAAFLPDTNEIMYNKNKMPLTSFHEMGHAINKHKTKFSKFLQENCRNNKKLVAIIPLLAMLAPSKSQQNLKPMSDEDKAIGMFRDNAGLLASATFLPTILEEGSATLKGNKLAKKVLSPELLKKVKRSNAVGLSTYILSAATIGIGTSLGVKIKDAVIKNSLENNKQ